MRIGTILAGLWLAAGAAQAQAPDKTRQDYNRADLVRGLCQPDGCDEFAILSVEPVRTTPEGVLKRTRFKTFHASSSGREARSEETGYVYCSQTRPAVVAEKQGRTVGILLAPFATQDSRETVRRYANVAATYFAVCHGLESGRAAAKDLAGVAHALGYRVPAPQTVTIDLRAPEDVAQAAPQAAQRPNVVAPAKPAAADERREDESLTQGPIPED
ncbi:hypothetical protein [Methylobacterium oxalidis]|uniref:Lipoprotein n=1 Tax=Methylobacterium oxalidis TaxID=944322 RepID=A0A512J650_9HYPH|nr:hypothetical protein [Methylobacterium oxalidis]GEP05403.1 hypothetical protein MOX02_34410 [Methylobacterium oxalidis]GJE34507.1 hypothetical protein LDDCCGHA_4718 [Methylobacterium oxalidis]GLS66293.1 hypothetical protein GCM10007888_46750 [Methylobacterium oxalidis]